MSFFYHFNQRFLALALFWVAIPLMGHAEEGRIHPAPQQRPSFVRDGLTVMGQDGSRQSLWLEVARSPDELAYGLMQIKELPETDGMLFVVEQPRPLLFWMKDTLIPLDLLFVDANGHITNIAANQKPHSLRYIASLGIAKAVLEISGGMAARWGIKVGDNLLYKDFLP